MKKLSRRSFVAQTSLAAAAAPVMISAAEAPKKTGFVHQVFFWMKNPDNPTEHAQLAKALKDLGKIESIRTAFVGTPTKTEFDKGATDDSYTFSVVLFFDDAKGEETYLYHPLHKKFIDDNKHLWKKVVVYDSLPA
jgi:hypothetical protein